jgi:hypothetical protein
MSWRLAAHSGKVVFSYFIPCTVKTFRDAIFNEDVTTILNSVIQKPKLLHQAIDTDGHTALGKKSFRRLMKGIWNIYMSSLKR